MPRTAQQTFEAAGTLSTKCPLVCKPQMYAPKSTKVQIMHYLTELSRLYFEMRVVAAIPNATDDDVRNSWFRATFEPKVYENYREHLRQKEKKESDEVSQAEDIA